MEEKKCITTEQMLEALKNDPDNEHEYCLSLCGGIMRERYWNAILVAYGAGTHKY